MPALFLFLLLGAYWALLSGQFHNGFLLVVGLLCITFVVWMGQRMGLLDDEGVPVRFYPRAILYVPYLAWQVLLSNWDVFKRTWSSSLPIDPRMARIPYSTRHAFVTTTYANSITLTPGTVTVSVDDKTMLIHCLTQDGEDGLLEGDMERHVKRLEG
ncbi:MAG: Na+/H+ antiporter subunit E [Nannocystis sp.]|nr:Na+/H+ antiporter subunit E [Nannocystis sp.]MBA3550244.1 Na+/H+ antiporter subunit E [Nannocystis sp.]